MSTLVVDTLKDTDQTVSIDIVELLTTTELYSTDYTSTATGAVTRTLGSKLGEIVSVKDFGAVGDGTTDDTAAIQLAITAGLETNYCLYFPPGYYVVSSAISLPLGDKTHMRLMGGGTHLTTIKLTGEQSFLNVTSNAGNWWIDSLTPNGGLQIDNMTLACWGGSNNSGIALNFSDMGQEIGRPPHGVRMSNVNIKTEIGYFAYGMVLNNASTFNIDTCKFFSANNSGEGIGIIAQADDGNDGGGLWVSNTEFLYYDIGIYVKDHFEGNYITACSFGNCNIGFLAQIEGAESGVLITNCEFDCFVKGIRLQNMYDFTISGNCFLGIDSDGQDAIHIDGGSGFSITGNKITGVGTAYNHGILLENTDDANVRASYVGGNAISNVASAMTINNCANITFGPWAWRSCAVSTTVVGTNTYIQQGSHEMSSTLTRTLGANTTSWTISVDISSLRLESVPAFAQLIPSSSSMVCIYNYASSSSTTAVFDVNLATGGTIPANTYRFSFNVKQPYFAL